MGNNVQAAVVVTSIAPPTGSMRTLTRGAMERSIRVFCIGDVDSPAQYALEGCEFMSIDSQRTLPYRYARSVPERHYARKNIGYLKAVEEGAELIMETDDDNEPDHDFWNMSLTPVRYEVSGKGWFNVYEWFGADAWPRGYPLEYVLSNNDRFTMLESVSMDVGVWQGLAAGDPDVDAIFRLTRREPVEFTVRDAVLLGRSVWSPFNSQNTHWAKRAFPFLYLPATCSFRVTDIVRGYVAMRCLWEMGQGVVFLPPTATQDRNIHELLRDFRDEIPIYFQAKKIVEVLETLMLKSSERAVCDNMRRCYEELVELDVVNQSELDLLDAWCEDLTALGVV